MRLNFILFQIYYNMYLVPTQKLVLSTGEKCVIKCIKESISKVFFHPSICIWKSSTVLQLGRWVQDNEICIHADQHKKISSSKILEFSLNVFFFQIQSYLTTLKACVLKGGGSPENSFL